MAGNFGYGLAHYEVSQACGERVLFSAVRGTASDDLVVAPASTAPPDHRLLRQPPQAAHGGVAFRLCVKRLKHFTFHPVLHPKWGIAE